MTFHINSNLTPIEAIRMHTELQIHPIIEEWAIKAERMDEIDKLAEQQYLFGLNNE